MATNNSASNGELTKYICIKEVVAASLTEKPRLQHNAAQWPQGGGGGNCMSNFKSKQNVAETSTPAQQNYQTLCH